MNVLSDIGLWLWRLLPGNPILVRVVTAGGKRVRHLWARVVYLVALLAVMLLVGDLNSQGSLADLAKTSTRTFMWVSMVQLFLMSFIAPVFTAGAITQEKDANTFHILLTTPLSTGQIVLGSLFSRLYFVWVLLLSGLPVFCITMIYGGVTTREVFESFALAACTGLITGSLAIFISVARIGTRRTIFSFFAGVALYLLGIWALGLTPWGMLDPQLAPQGTAAARLIPERMSWLAPVHPFLALFVITGQTPAPDPADVLAYGWPWSWLLASPAYGYMAITTLLSVVMILLSLYFVRQSAREGEVTLLSRLKALVIRTVPGEERRKKPRTVWNNPIAWREAATRASAAGRSFARWAFIVGGIAGGILLLVAHEQSWGAGLSPAKPEIVRGWLLAITWIELAVALLVVTVTAASTLTREKESMTMELLLASPLTSQYIIAGMLRGLVSFALPMLAVPAATLLVFAVADLFRGDPAHKVVLPEAVVLAPLLMTSFTALAAMIGLYWSLVSRKTVQAVMISAAVVLLGSGLLTMCGFGMGRASGQVAAVVMPFTPPLFAIEALIDVEWLFSPNPGSAPPRSAVQTARITRIVTTLLAAATYAGITFAMYQGMVRNFDMTVRRQSANT